VFHDHVALTAHGDVVHLLEESLEDLFIGDEEFNDFVLFTLDRIPLADTETSQQLDVLLLLVSVDKIPDDVFIDVPVQQPFVGDDQIGKSVFSLDSVPFIAT